MSKSRLPKLKSLCVFCGSSPGSDPRHLESAARLGRALLAGNVQLVYGGGHLGMMGALAETVIGGGGRVVGIIPEHLTRVEKAYLDITELHIVDSMHTRKRMMFDMADAFAVLPGGMGTMDETFEILTWKQLQLHNKPIVIINQDGYWNPWLALADHIVANAFAHPNTTKLFSVVDDVDQVLDHVQSGLERSSQGQSKLF